jgi:tetratricopeptide (TPR) repeat protein
MSVSVLRQESPGNSGFAQAVALAEAMSAADVHLQKGNLAQALRALLAVREPASRNQVSSNLIGYLLLQQDRFKDALPWFEAALAAEPGHPAALAGQAMSLQELGRSAEAVLAYQAAIKAGRNDAETFYNLGVAQHACGQFEQALASFAQACTLRPDYVTALKRLSSTLAQLGQLKPALDVQSQIFALEPDCADTWCARGNIEQSLDHMAEAIACYDKAISLRPRFGSALANRAAAKQICGHAEAALADIDAALKFGASSTEALLTKAYILKDLKRESDALASFRKAAKSEPPLTFPATTSPAAARVLLVFSPITGNTPFEDMASNTPCHCEVLLLVPGVKYDVQALRKKTDLVVNLVSDADCDAEVLACSRELIEALKLPVINRPDLVSHTDREEISSLLAQFPQCVVPKTLLISAEALKAKPDIAALGFSYPVIIRPAGTHGGEGMELVHDAAALTVYLQNAVSKNVYLTHYVNYASPDGHFRKCRFIFVGSKIMPYHLAIGDHWKVHHATTRMAEHQWMQDEESLFLDEPERFFSVENFAALEAIRSAVGLDYFGIDCGLDPQGRLLVFEANASMLVHLHNEQFPYKDPHVLAIKQAFSELLAARASKHGLPVH